MEPKNEWEGAVVEGVEIYVRGLFATPAAQLAFLERANVVRGWDFTFEDFAGASRALPAWPEGRLAALVLVPVPRHEPRRADADLAKLAAGRANAWASRPFLPNAAARLLTPTSAPGLRWEAVDFGAEDVQRRSSTVLLASAAQHPEWIRAMSRGRTPTVLLPGTYETDTDLLVA